jgi:hypothetical protein
MWPILDAALGGVALVMLVATVAKWHAKMIWRADRAFFGLRRRRD